MLCVCSHSAFLLLVKNKKKKMIVNLNNTNRNGYLVTCEPLGANLALCENELGITALEVLHCIKKIGLPIAGLLPINLSVYVYNYCLK